MQRRRYVHNKERTKGRKKKKKKKDMYEKYTQTQNPFRTKLTHETLTAHRVSVVVVQRGRRLNGIEVGPDGFEGRRGQMHYGCIRAVEGVRVMPRQFRVVKTCLAIII